MRQYRLAVGLCGIAALVLAGCHHEVPDDIPMLESKIGFPDRFYDVQALSADEAVIVGYAGKILKTEDAGQTWSQLPSGTRDALYAVDWVDDRHVWVTGQEGLILYSADGGKTWERQQSGTLVYLFAVDFVDEKEGWIVGDKATYLHTVDGGKSWKQRQFEHGEGLTADEELIQSLPVLYDVQFIDRQTGWVVGEFGKIYHTADGGVTWGEQQASLAGEVGGEFVDAADLPTFFSIAMRDPQNGLVAGLQGRVARTRDGRTWRFEEFEVSGPFDDPLYMALQLPDSTAWAVGAAGQVVRREGAGTPWKRVSLGMELNGWLRDVDFFDRNHGWIVGGYGRILRTQDGGNTWLQMLG